MELLESAKSGNRLAFKNLVERYEAPVARTVKAMLGNTADAEDVGQRVFLKFYHAMGEFRGSSSLKTYLTRIAINESINQLRKNKRYSNLQKRHFEGLNTPEDLSPKMEGFEENKHLKYSLNSLHPKFKSVLVLRYFNDASTEEISKVLDIPIGTVLSRIKRAQQKLKKMLLQKEGVANG